MQTRTLRTHLARALGIAALSTTLTACMAEGDMEGEDLDLGEDTAHIVGGENDSTSRINDAVVHINYGCTGTLVAPDVVLTAAHCLGRRADRPPGAPPTGDWETRGVWYDLPDPYPVHFGNDLVGLGADAAFPVTQATFTIEAAGQPAGAIINHGMDVSFKSSGGLYVVAENGGGHYLAVNRQWPNAWERFRLTRWGGGTLRSADEISLQADNGDWVVSELYEGGDLNANRSAAGPWERFTIERIGGGGLIRSGDRVAIKANNNGRYWLARNGGGGGWRHIATAVQYNLSVGEDIGMIKLDAPVPSSVAKPISPLTRQPRQAGDNATSFWASQAFRTAGWGWIDAAETKQARYRQRATAHGGAYPSTRGDDTTNFITASLDDGAFTRHGDSGSPLLWTSPSGREYTVGALQGDTGYVSTFGVGTSGSGNPDAVNVAVWIEQVLGLRDCSQLDPTNASVIFSGGKYRVVDGSHWLMAFSTRPQADHAVSVLQRFGLDEICYVDRPAEMYYALSGGNMPAGTGPSGERCRYFGGTDLNVYRNAGRWVLRDMTQGVTLQTFDDELDARLAMGLLRRHGARRQCYFDGGLLPHRNAGGAGDRFTYYKR